MANTGGMGFMGKMPEQFNVSVNSNHPLIQKIIGAENEEAKIKIAKQSYDLALLSQGLLKGADLTNFIQRTVELASK